MNPLLLVALLLHHPIGRQLLLGSLFGGQAHGMGALQPPAPAPALRRQTQPRARRPGTPALQGHHGATRAALRNPNQGGFNGLGGSEMATPGLGSGLFGGGSIIGALRPGPLS